MNTIQYDLYKNRKKQMRKIADTIEGLGISEKWVERLTAMCYYRAYKKLNKSQQSQMINIATVNSPAVIHLLGQKQKKVGLCMLDDISMKIDDERDRGKAMQFILDKGAKEAKNNIDLLIAKHKQNIA